MINIQNCTLRVVKKTEKHDINEKISCTFDAYDAFNKVFSLDSLAEENIVMFTFDIKNKITGAFTVAIGSLSSAIVHPREVLKRALLINASAIMIAHNHPSGDPNPSDEDILITRRLKEACNLMGISLLDHIIVGEGCFYSLAEMGKMS